jgi:hypothetical protein
MAIFSDIQLGCSEIISKGLFPILPLFSIADEENMKKYYGKNPQHRLNNLKLSPTQIIIESSGHCTDIACNTKFDVLFSHHNVENFIITNSVLEYVSFNRSYEVDCLPNGYSSLCIVNFPDEKPELLNKLRPETAERDLSKFDVLYLTQSTVMERILNELK